MEVLNSRVLLRPTDPERSRAGAVAFSQVKAR
jgi:hypothetical protein